LSDYKLAYRVNPQGDLWRWEVFQGTKLLSQGQEKTNSAARVQAILFVLQTEQEDA
jgi:hypothetical protein